MSGAPAARFARTAALYGAAGFARIRSGGAVVVGLGGVGAHCAVSLARSGIGRLLLVDFDRVTESSLNRHPVAGPRDVGRLKTEVLAAWAQAICPDTVVDTETVFVGEETLPGLLAPAVRERYPVLVDAIDSLNPKVGLIAGGLAAGFAVISSMGAAGKRDPSRVRLDDLAATRTCPLARHVRQRLRRRGISGGILCVYSEEPPVPPLDPDPDDAAGAPAPGRVRRRQPSNMSLPGIFGLALTAAVLDRLAGVGPGTGRVATIPAEGDDA